MAEEQSSAPHLTSAAIRGECIRFRSLERDILEEVISGEKAAGADAAQAVDDQAQKIRDRAAAHLNGHAADILPRTRGRGRSLSEARIDLAAVRLILESLTKRQIEVVATEAMEKAEELRPAFDRLRRAVVLKIAELHALAAQVDAFHDGAGEARHALPGIYVPGLEYYADLIEKGVAEGLATHADIRKAAQNARAH